MIVTKVEVLPARGLRGYTGPDAIEIGQVLGRPPFSTNMGDTEGNILSDNGTAKQWFQESEAAIEERIKPVTPFNVITGGSDISLYDRLGRKFDLFDVGALDDNTTDLAPALNLAAAKIVAAGGGMIRIPKGNFALLSNMDEISVPGEESVKVIGEGRDQSYIRIGASATRGIRFRSTTTTPNRLARFDISGMTLAASGEDVDWAVDAEWAINGDIEDPFMMDDMAIQQYLKSLADDGTDYGYFRRLVRVSNSRNGNIKNFRFFGDMDRADAAKTEVAIQLDGECTSFRIENGYVLEAQKGIYTSAETEGLYCHNIDLIAVDTGVDFGSGSALEPQLTWQGGTIAAYETALNIQNCRYFRVADTFLLCKGGVNAQQPSKNWTGVKVSGSLSGWGTIDAEFSKEHGQGSGGATSTAVDVVTGDGIEVRGSVHGFDASDPIDYGVRLRSGVTRSKADVQTRNVTTDYDYTPADGNTVIRRNPGEMQILGGNDQYLSIIGQAAAWLKLMDLGGGLNDKEIRFLNDGGNFAIYLVNDDGSTKKNPFLITSGGVPVVGDGVWNSMPLRLGNFHLWVDGTGNLRIKSSAPSSATDGIVVGTQA